MRVISKPRLRAFWMRHPDARMPLMAWWKTALAADWSNLMDLRAVFPHADAVTLANGLTLTVFNLAGNKYRLIVRIIYDYRRIYVKSVLTHADYSKENWKVKLCRE